MNSATQVLQKNLLEHKSVICRDDPYISRYFDRQISYRYLFKLFDSNMVEATAYQHFLNGKPVDLAIDISSMVGCPMGCKFCESALIKYSRTLTTNEMIAQVAQLIKDRGDSQFPKITCSFQGIGEPSIIAEKVVEVGFSLLKIDERIAISIATIGECLSAFKLWRQSNLPIDNLQVSSGGTTEPQINYLMPRSSKIKQLIEEAKICTFSPNIEKVKFNYILVKDFNDSDKDIERLISLFKDSNIIVKISFLNPTIAASQHLLLPGSFERAKEISYELQSNGIDSFVFGAFNSMNISCGQLAFVQGDV
jgi:23S rRNA (adenine2503-C2)-methyltransferase